jgi:hypothetical protein
MGWAMSQPGDEYDVTFWVDAHTDSFWSIHARGDVDELGACLHFLIEDWALAKNAECFEKCAHCETGTTRVNQWEFNGHLVSAAEGWPTQDMSTFVHEAQIWLTRCIEYVQRGLRAQQKDK